MNHTNIRKAKMTTAEFMKRCQRDQLDVPASAYSQCARITMDLCAFLESTGVTGFRRLMVRDPADPSRAFDPRDTEHWVVFVGELDALGHLEAGIIVDPTRRQFDPNCELPTVYDPFTGAANDWRCYLDEDDIEIAWPTDHL